LLEAAEQAGFEVLITTDRNMRYQQNVTGRKLAVIVLGKGRWTLVKPCLSQIADAVNASIAGSYAEVEIPFPARTKP
jgi:hypothetical protein